MPTSLRIRGVLSAALLIVSWSASGQSRSTTRPLPEDLSTALRGSGCRVPSAPAAYGSDSSAVIAHVAYRASVRGKATADWIVLCERASRREVFVYATPLRGSSGPALTLPLTWYPDEPGCEGWIGVADSAWVRAALTHAFRVRLQLVLTAEERRLPLHVGILDGMCEGDGMRYWTGRRWITFPAHWDGP
jgi:hypothetical protein